MKAKEEKEWWLLIVAIIWGLVGIIHLLIDETSNGILSFILATLLYIAYKIK